MQDTLRERITRKLDALSDERGYQVLDFVEFLESKYADRQNAAAITTAFSWFTDTVEDKLRAGRVSATTIAETVGLMNRAAGVLNGALQATKAAANELVRPQTPPPSAPSAPATAPDASLPAGDTVPAGSGEGKI